MSKREARRWNRDMVWLDGVHVVEVSSPQAAVQRGGVCNVMPMRGRFVGEKQEVTDSIPFCFLYHLSSVT